MKILLMDTGRGTRTGSVDTWRAGLGLNDDDDVSFLSWNVPGEALPVVEHLVFGPELSARRREPRRCATTTGLFDDADITVGPPRIPAPPATDAPAGVTPPPSPRHEQPDNPPTPSTHAPSETPADPISEALLLDGEDFLGDERFDDAVLARRARNATASLPVYHPRRLRKAASWRLNKARVLGRRGVAKVRREVTRKDSPTGKAMTILSNDSISVKFGVAVMRSQQAKRLFADADVVVPLDARSQRAAWLLARAVEGPDVVITLPAAARTIAARRTA